MINLKNEKVIVSEEEKQAIERLKSFKKRYVTLFIRKVEGNVCLCSVDRYVHGENVKVEVCFTGVENTIIKSLLQFLSPKYDYKMDDIINILEKIEMVHEINIQN